MKKKLLFFITLGLCATHIQSMEEDFKTPEAPRPDETVSSRSVDEYIKASSRRGAVGNAQDAVRMGVAPEPKEETTTTTNRPTLAKDSGFSINLTDAQTKIQAITDRLHHLPEADQQRILNTLQDFNSRPRTPQDVQTLIQVLEQNPAVKAILEGTNNGQGRTWMQLLTDPKKITQMIKDWTLGTSNSVDTQSHGINTLNTILDMQTKSYNAPQTIITSDDLARSNPDSLGIKDYKPSRTVSTPPTVIPSATPETSAPAAPEIKTETEPVIARITTPTLPEETKTPIKSTSVQIKELRALIEQEGDTQKAADAYKKIADLSSRARDKQAALQQAAQVYEKIGSYFDAGTIYKQLAESAPNSTQKISFYTESANMYGQDKTSGSSRTMGRMMLEQAVKIAESDSSLPAEILQPLYSQLGDVYTKTGNYAQAGTTYAKAANTAAADPQTQIDLLTKAQNAYESAGNSVQAENLQARIEMLQEALPPAPEQTVLSRASSAASTAATSINSGLSRAGSAVKDAVSRVTSAPQQYNPDEDDLSRGGIFS